MKVYRKFVSHYNNEYSLVENAYFKRVLPPSSALRSPCGPLKSYDVAHWEKSWPRRVRGCLKALFFSLFSTSYSKHELTLLSTCSFNYVPNFSLPAACLSSFNYTRPFRRYNPRLAQNLSAIN